MMGGPPCTANVSFSISNDFKLNCPSLLEHKQGACLQLYLMSGAWTYICRSLEACVSAPEPDRECWQCELRAVLAPRKAWWMLSQSNSMEGPAVGPMSKHQTGRVRVQIDMSSSCKGALCP